MPAEAPLPQSPFSDTGRARRWLTVAAVLSAGVIVVAARTADARLAAASAVGFVLAAVIAVVATARSWLHSVANDANDRQATKPPRDSAILAAIAYAWGAVAMQGAYLTPLTGQKWQHGWQYALAMALLAAISLAFARAVDHASKDDNAPAVSGLAKLAGLLAVAQALIAGGGFATLALTGKLWSTRADWAANCVFAGLAAAIVVISVAYVVAGRRPQRR